MTNQASPTKADPPPSENPNDQITSYHWNVLGHKKELALLEEKLASRDKNGFPHAILFVGPDNIGKFTIAKMLAQILQCPNNSCKSCPTCIQISKGYHLDTIEMDDDGTSIKIEQIREIISRINMTAQSRCKILLLANIGRLTEEAGNSLLKILEEPTERTFFFFTAVSLREVLPTIASRMQIMKLKTPPESELKIFLKNLYSGISEQTIDETMMLSLNKPGKTIELINNQSKLAFYKDLFGAVRSFCGIEPRGGETAIAQKFQFIQGIAEDHEYVKEFLILMTAYLRHLLFLEKNPARKKQLVETIEKTQDAFEAFKRNSNPKLLLENLSL